MNKVVNGKIIKMTQDEIDKIQDFLSIVPPKTLPSLEERLEVLESALRVLLTKLPGGK